MAAGDIDLSSIISHRFHWKEMRKAFELAAMHDKTLVAAVFNWGV
jgi:threonine dehydrogenase-like Zn-dependent dehydrogenase